MLLPLQVGCSKLTIWARQKNSGKNDVCIVFIRLRTLKSDKNSLVLDANLGATKKYDFKNSVYIVYQCFRALKSHKKRSRFESWFWTPYLLGDASSRLAEYIKQLIGNQLKSSKEKKTHLAVLVGFQENYRRWPGNLTQEIYILVVFWSFW